MVVYGDPGYEEALSALTAQLKARLAPLLSACEAALPLDTLRALLIHAGQLEQAAADALPALLPIEEARRQIGCFQEVTDAAARAFLARWAPGQDGIPLPLLSASGALLAMARAAESRQDIG